MRRKLTWVVLLSAAIMVTALFHASPAWATPANEFTSTPLAQGQFDQFNIFNSFVLPDSQVWLSRQWTKGLSDGAVLINARRTCTQRGWRLLTPVATTCTSSEMKAPSRHKSSLSGSFRQVSRVGLTLQLRGTAPSDEDGLFNATARDRRRGCLRCNSRENHGSDGVPFLHNAVLLSTTMR